MCNYRKKKHLNLLHHVTIYNIIHFVFAALLGHFFIFKNTCSRRIENWRRPRVSTPEDPSWSIPPAPGKPLQEAGVQEDRFIPAYSVPLRN